MRLWFILTRKLYMHLQQPVKGHRYIYSSPSLNKHERLRVQVMFTAVDSVHALGHSEVIGKEEK
ncbi:hypothetical protein MTR_5g011430 [Medicago truncatula]|uniref:Uncharacterized protein n=1 Tax=Medicago truncatula TaxID=3880 RepID=G7KEV7_MEDTR|nr:hypothetical protein MTR_5g011430 [Medicago truncatula]